MQRFSAFAQWASDALGSAWSFYITITVIGLWIIGGFVIGFSDTYQIIINTVSTLVTSVYVVIIQNSQNRQERAVQRKLDELIKAIDTADNRLIGLEKQPENACPPVTGEEA